MVELGNGLLGIGDIDLGTVLSTASTQHDILTLRVFPQVVELGRDRRGRGHLREADTGVMEQCALFNYHTLLFA